MLNPGVRITNAHFKRRIYSDSDVDPMRGGWGDTGRALRWAEWVCPGCQRHVDRTLNPNDVVGRWVRCACGWKGDSPAIEWHKRGWL